MSEAATLRLRFILTKGGVSIKTNCKMSKKEAVSACLNSATLPQSTKEAHDEIINEGDEHAEENPEKDEKKMRRGSIHAGNIKQDVMPASNNPKREDEEGIGNIANQNIHSAELIRWEAPFPLNPDPVMLDFEYLEKTISQFVVSSSCSNSHFGI